MGIGVSLVLIAVGAILTWAINATVSGVDINAVGVILMIVGAVGLLLSLMFWSWWGGVAASRARDATSAGHDGTRKGHPRRPRYVGRGLSEAPAQRRTCPFQATGSSNANVEPRPGSEVTQIRPSMRRTSSRQM